MTVPPKTENTIPSRWQPFVRAVWVASAILMLTLYFVGLPVNYHELNIVCEADPCRVTTISSGELQILEDIGFSLQAYIFYYFILEGFLIILFAMLAGLIFWHKSETWLGIVVSLALLFAGFVFFAEETRSVARAYPQFETFINFLISTSVVLVLLLFYLFPDGRFTPRWMRWFAAALIVAVILEPLLNPGGEQTTSTSMFVILAFALGAPMGLISQIYRFRNVSNPTQRQQTKWVLYGFMGMFSGMLPWMVFAEITQIAPGPGRLLFYLSLIPQYILIGFFPISVVIAIMRYRLWEVDLVIRRTIQYALMTGLLALTYFGSVILLQTGFRTLTGQTNSPLITVLSTLGIAALFTPLRRRVQDFIDRRFYRKKYNAEQALAEFAVITRDEVDMDKLTAALIGVVNETVQPEKVSIWLKDFAAKV